MSGPKVSIYEVAPYIRENILQQQRLIRRCNVLRREIRNRADDFEALSEKCKALLQVRFDKNNQSCTADHCKTLLDLIHNKKLALVNDLQQLGPVEKMPEKYRYSPETVEKKKNDLLQLQNIQSVYTRNLEAIQQQIVTVMDTLHAEQHEAKKDISHSGIIGHFDFDDIAVQTEKYNWIRRDAALNRVRKINRDAALSDSLRDRAEKAAEKLQNAATPDQADHYILIVVSNIEEEAERERQNHKQEYQEYSTRIAEYHAICEELGKQPESIPFTTTWRENFGNAFQTLESCLSQGKEKEYISDCLDAVMAEMGYKVIGYRNVQKKSGRKFHSSLYAYADGRAINVTERDDGQITMEIGGIDRQDRIPTVQEAELLEADMYSFCDRFEEIEQRLQKMGVQMRNRIAKPAPNQEYATIINLDDFILTGNQNIETIDVADIKQGSGMKEMYEE